MSIEPTPDDIKRMRNCKHCSGLRYVLSADGQTAEDCPHCLKQIKYGIRLAESGIPPRFQSLEFSDYIYQESLTYKNVWKYIDQADKAIEKHLCLLLYGTKNTGKSLLASCMLKEIMKKNYSCSFVTFTESFSDDEIIKTRLSDDYQFCCIDDITDVLNSLVNFTVTPLTDEKTNGAITKLKEIITNRARQNCITVLTSLVPISVFEANPTFKGLGSVLRGNFEEIKCVDGDFVKRNSEQRKGEFGFEEVL